MLNSYLPILGYEKEGDFLGERLDYSMCMAIGQTFAEQKSALTASS